MADKYPEHEKLKALRGANQIVGDFIEWFNEQGYTLCSFDSKREEYVPIYKNRDTLLAEHFGIDQSKLDREKDQILEDFRRAQEERS